MSRELLRQHRAKAKVDPKVNIYDAYARLAFGVRL